MKINKKTIYTLLIACLSIPSCNTDDLSDTGLADMTDTKTDMTFKATTGTTLSKSTVAHATGHTSFSADDHIKVFTLEGEDSEFANTNADEGTEAWFSGKLNKSNGYYAILPYQKNATISGDIITLTLPATQQSDYQDLMVAYTKEQDHSFQFKHIGAMIKFVTYRAYKKIKIEATDGTQIAGELQVKIAKDGTKPQVTGGTSNTITLERDIQKYDTVLVTLKPTTIPAGKLKITFTKDDNTTFVHIIDKEINLQSGTMYTYGNVGQYKITCYKDDTDSEILFSMYMADYDKSHETDLPKLPSPTPGKIYGYSQTYGSTTATYKDHIKTTLDRNITVYPVLVDGIQLTIYNKGNNNDPITMLTFPSVSVRLPEIEMPEKPGYGYIYTDGSREYETNYTTSNTNAVLTLSEKKMKTINYYTNGADKDPKTEYILPTNTAKITLPEPPAKTGYYAGYTKKTGATQYEYFAGQDLYASDLSDITNFYPVYRANKNITTTAAISTYAGMTLGTADYTTNDRLTPQTLAQIPEGTAATFKIINHGSINETNSNNVMAVRLCGENNPYSSNSKELTINPKNSANTKYAQISYDLQSINLMQNLNGAEITVKISNHGGIADIEYTWTGTDDKKTNKVTYNNICVWDQLFVTFTVTKAYLEFK